MNTPLSLSLSLSLSPSLSLSRVIAYNLLFFRLPKLIIVICAWQTSICMYDSIKQFYPERDTDILIDFNETGLNSLYRVGVPRSW